MKILSVESSCDETAVAVVEDGRTILTDCIASQIALHRLYGGVVPELASRKHIEAIYALADTALDEAHLTRQDIDAIAVTYAPGLIGAVLVGVNFAKPRPTASACRSSQCTISAGISRPTIWRTRIWNRRFCASSSPAGTR